MKKRIINFVTPKSASDLDNLDSLLDAAGETDGETDGELDDSDIDDTDGELDDQDIGDTDGELDDTEEPTQEEIDAQAEILAADKRTRASKKQEYAFGQMRKQNTQVLTILEKLAKANNVEYTDKNDLVAKMSDKALGDLATNQNVPKELLEKIDTLERSSNELSLQRRQVGVEEGFKTLIDKYELTEDELHSFANELDTNGINPMEKDGVDLVEVYKLMHFDDILNNATERAVQKALGKSNDADAHSTKPSGQHGKANATEKVTSVDALNRMLDRGVK